MALRLHISTHVGHHHHAVRPVLGLLHSPDRATDLHGQDPASERAAERLPLGAALPERLAGGPLHLELRGRPSGAPDDNAPRLVQTVEHGGIVGTESELRRRYLGRLRPHDGDADASRAGLASGRGVRRQSDESYRAGAPLCRHSLRIDQRRGERVRLPSALRNRQYSGRTR